MPPPSEHVMNVNDMVEVVLTERGLKVLHERDPVVEKFNLTGTTLRTQLWTLMHIFGERMVMGVEPCFVGCRITVRIET